MTSETQQIYVLDYGAGNVLSLINSLKEIGIQVKFIKEVDDFKRAHKIIFPGVGSFGAAMDRLHDMNFFKPLQQYIRENRPFMGICVGMQALYNSSTESPQAHGLGVIDGEVKKFTNDHKSVPHIGWNGAVSRCKLSNQSLSASSSFVDFVDSDARYYFVHSYAVTLVSDVSDPSKVIEEDHALEWAHTLTTYGDETFVSSVSKGNLFATQFHPEKSGKAGLDLLRRFVETDPIPVLLKSPSLARPPDMLTCRIIACLDVRSNDDGDLVVTKGDQYDVREKTEEGHVRNLGKPVELAKRYYEQGADEVTFLNITSFRDCPLLDTPMLSVLKATSESVFVPLTIGGGIRDMIQPDGTVIKALDVAGAYFRSGADKVSIGSDAVYISLDYIQGKDVKGNAISSIAHVYGVQAVVISVDPKRVYVSGPEETSHATVMTQKPGPNGERFCWYQCTVKGGREVRDLDVVQLTQTCELLGAGEILLNCMDHDGMNQGYDIELISMVKKAVSIPVIASSGAGKVEHFDKVFRYTGCDAALAAGIFHRQEVGISEVKQYLRGLKYEIRN